MKRKQRELNAPKRPPAPYVLFLSERRLEAFPDGHFPVVKSVENFRFTQENAAKWKSMSTEERQQYVRKYEQMCTQYNHDVEAWKREMEKPENVGKLNEIELLSKRMKTVMKMGNKNVEVKKKNKKKVAATKKSTKKESQKKE